ncbi:MAG: hypothetical protein IKW60_01175 [Clostridia bacterium]|nr:hypothetical protein [Clostridia bacterium]
MPFKFYKEKTPAEGETVKIRETLNNMGFSNDRIGYNEADNTVTLDGKKLMTPTYLDEENGVSYASGKAIQQSLVNFYKDSKNPIVRVSDAFSDSAGRYGISADALTYGNGTVSIGGKPLDILYIDDEGKSWAYRDAVEQSVENLAQRNQLESPNEVMDGYQKQYLTRANHLLKQLQNREEFQYDPESDPVYLAYKEQYMAEGNRASQNALAEYATLTGGLPNSAAITAAAQAEQYYAKKIADTIPQLAQRAYQQYRDEYQNDVKLLETAINMYKLAYQDAREANREERDNLNSTYASNVERDKVNREQNWKELQNNQTAEKNLLQMEGLALGNLQKQMYLKYYETLLQEQLEGEQLSNRLSQVKLYK